MLCPTAQLIASALDGSSESAFLLTTSGIVLHRNPSALVLFEINEDDPRRADDAHVSSFLVFAQDWDDFVAEAAHRKDATALKSAGVTSNVKVSLTRLGGCPCCNALYVCAHVHEAETDRLELVKDTVDASFDAMLTVDENGIILMANEAACDLFGWTCEEFVGNNISIICGGGHAAHHNEYMKHYLETGIKKVMGTKREVPARRKDGSEFPVELGIKEIHSHSSSERVFCGFIKDLSEQKKYIEEIQNKESLTQGMINSSFDPMFQIDEKGIIGVVNQAAVSMFGWTHDEFIGSNISLICGGGHAEHHDEYISRYLQTGKKRIIGIKRQTPARRKDGSEFHIELGVQEVLSSNGDRAFCGYVRDLTQQKLDKQNLIRKERLIQNKFFGDSTPNEGEA